MIDSIFYKAREGFFSSYTDIIYDLILENGERLEFDYGLLKLNRLKIDDDLSLNKLKKIIKRMDESEVKEELIASLKTEKVNKELLKKAIRQDVISHDDLATIFNEEFWEDVADPYEILANCTTYYKPEKWDEETAYKCCLFPFKYNMLESEVELLAFIGGGSDQTPCLDAYQILVSGTIDPHCPQKPARFERCLSKQTVQELAKHFSN